MNLGAYWVEQRIVDKPGMDTIILGADFFNRSSSSMESSTRNNARSCKCGDH